MLRAANAMLVSEQWRWSMRVVIAIVISLMLTGSAGAEVTITGEVFGPLEGIPGVTFPATGYPVIVYPAGKEVAVDGKGQYTIVTDEPQRLLVIVTPFDRVFAKRIDKMILREEPQGTFHLQRVVFGEDNRDPRLYHRHGQPRLLTNPDKILGAFDPPCHIDAGITEVDMIFQLLIGTAGEVSAVKVLRAGEPGEEVPDELVELTRQELFKLQFIPVFGMDYRPIEIRFAFPARLQYDEEAGWKFKKGGTRRSEFPDDPPDGRLRPSDEPPDGAEVFY